MTTPNMTMQAVMSHPEKLLHPQWAEITDITSEAEGISTYWLSFKDQAVQKAFQFEPGQFNMLYLPGFGKSAISISSDPNDHEKIGHTIRFVGNVTRGISRLKVGDVVGVRGPFGTYWPMKEMEGKDVFIACGGIGLPPLRPAIYHIIRNREKYGKVTLLYGSRTSSDLMFPDEYEEWRKAQIDVEVTVDRGDANWNGRVGVVPMWFYQFRLDPRKVAIFNLWT